VESYREERGLEELGWGRGTDNEGIHRWDLDQKLMGGNWEQELRGRGENQQGLGGGCSLHKGKART
jgi:hypothetical protein